MGYKIFFGATTISTTHELISGTATIEIAGQQCTLTIVRGTSTTIEFDSHIGSLTKEYDSHIGALTKEYTSNLAT